MRSWRLENNIGFTLIEVLIAIVSSSIIITGIYQIFHAHQNSYLNQDESIKMIQNLRAGMYQMTRDIRSVGYSPTRGTYKGERLPDEDIGFVSKFKYYGVFNNTGGFLGGDSGPINYSNNTTRIAFTIDKDGDCLIEDDNEDIVIDTSSSIDYGIGTDPCHDRNNVDNNRDDGARGERIAYRLFDNKLERFNSEIYVETLDIDRSWETLITDVEALNFVFLDAKGKKFSGDEKDLNDIKSVEVALLVRSGSKNDNRNTNPVYRNRQGDVICDYCPYSKYKFKILHSRIKIRNGKEYGE